MKKLFLIACLIISSTAFSQNYIVNFCEDKIEKKTFYSSKEKIYVKSSDGKSAFLVSLYFEKKDNKVICTGLTVKSVVGSSCVENSNLHLVLENDDVITLTAWNKFNCESISYFDFSDEQIKKLSESEVKTLRFKNGYDFQTLTGFEKGKETIFIRAFNNIVLNFVNCD